AGNPKNIFHALFLKALDEQIGCFGHGEVTLFLNNVADSAGSSGNGMNSASSASGSFIRPACQSEAAWASLSFEEDTKFQCMNRSPTGSPPSAMTLERSRARTCDAAAPSTSILPLS